MEKLTLHGTLADYKPPRGGSGHVSIFFKIPLTNLPEVISAMLTVRHELVAALRYDDQDGNQEKEGAVKIGRAWLEKIEYDHDGESTVIIGAMEQNIQCRFADFATYRKRTCRLILIDISTSSSDEENKENPPDTGE